MNYRWKSGETIDMPIGKAVCVGRNYVEHAAELGNQVPSEPLLFIKPSTSMASASNIVALDNALGEHHYEAELTLLVGKTLNKYNLDDYHECILGVGVSLDLTLRDLQSELKQKGHPWERAKAFDNSCLVSPFVPFSALENTQSTFALTINNETRQLGHVNDMIFDIKTLLSEIVKYFTLMPGDLVLTGTPKGVGKLVAKDNLSLYFNDTLLSSCQIQ